MPPKGQRDGLRGHSNNGGVNMINNHLPTAFGVLVVVAALAAPVRAAEATPNLGEERTPKRTSLITMPEGGYG
jgi:hypothetical protein